MASVVLWKSLLALVSVVALRIVWFAINPQVARSLSVRVTVYMLRNNLSLDGLGLCTSFWTFLDPFGPFWTVFPASARRLQASVLHSSCPIRGN